MKIYSKANQSKEVNPLKKISISTISNEFYKDITETNLSKSENVILLPPYYSVYNYDYEITLSSFAQNS